MEVTPIHIFGIRHHGPGSARSLRQALEALEPDCVLIEGPPDAEGVLGLAAEGEMKPPVALLVYVPEEPRRAVHYPFAVFSPEWQAIQYGLARKVPVRFIDLPQAIQLAQADEEMLGASARGECETASGGGSFTGGSNTTGSKSRCAGRLDAAGSASISGRGGGIWRWRAVGGNR